MHMSYHGTRYAVGVILSHGSTGGLSNFVEISQIVIVDSDLNFIVKLLNSWYYEHLRGVCFGALWGGDTVEHTAT